MNRQKLFLFVIGLGILGLMVWAQETNQPETADKPDQPPVAIPKEVTPKKTQPMIGEFGEKVYLKEKKIELEGYIAASNMPLELFVCAEGGKDYESVAVVKCRPQNIQLALILFGLREGKSPEYFGDPGRLDGDFILIFIEWEKDGKKVSYRAEDLIIDIRTKKTMPRAGWVFTGSKFVDEIDYDTQKPTGNKIYLANATKTIIATYHDPAAIIDNPTESGGLGNVYLPNKDIIPERGTKIKVTIRLPTQEESAELERINEEVAKWEKEQREQEENESKKEEDK